MSEVIKWPGWRFHPETGEGAIFQGPDEVPEGWVDNISDIKPKKPRREPKSDEDVSVTDEQKAQIAELEGKSQADLAAMLKAMNDKRAEDGQPAIEYLGIWPRRKLATTIVENGGSLPTEPAPATE